MTAQIGFNKDKWPVALLKELIDNALDACESANIAPAITLELRNDALIVADNGPGLPLSALERSLDYLVLVSDKNGYVSPSRGQQGNALKTLWAAPFVATGEGRIEVQTAAYRREVRVTLDRIAQEPLMELVDPSEPPDVKTGTKITLHWRGVAGYLNRYYYPTFYSTALAVADFNPHCSMTIVHARLNAPSLFPATDPDWQHWRPDRPTAPHWYTPESFRKLIALFLNTEQRGGKARSINELIREFHGLTGTGKAKAVAAATGLTGAMLRDLIQGGDVDMNTVMALLEAMQQVARPVKPEALGVLGVAHFVAALERYDATAESAEYRRATGDIDGLPYVLEVGFAIKEDADKSRTLRIGINFSPALAEPFASLDSALGDALCTNGDPVVVLVHLVCPAVQFTDRGKTKATLPRPIADDLQRMVKLATARFTKAKRQADRDGQMTARALEELANAHKVKPTTVTKAAYSVMVVSYLKASSNNTLPANARQIMYVARPLIIQLTGKKSPWKNSATFTQKLLNGFIADNPELCNDWDVVFDDRGHFTEPHTGKLIGIGTLAVRGYIRGWKKEIEEKIDNIQITSRIGTSGPALRFKFALFVEKEGFAPLLERAKIAESYDLAIMSTKGMSVTAARQLVEALSDAGVTILVMRDFDKAGFSIVHTLSHDTVRHQFKTPPNVIDIGFRLEDIEGLSSEDVEYFTKKDPRINLLERGATTDEIKFLVESETTQADVENGNDEEEDENDDDEETTGKKKKLARWKGKRVELNAMSSADLITWLKAKLDKHGVTKITPTIKELHTAWNQQWRVNQINKAIAVAIQELPSPPKPPPGTLARLKNRVESGERIKAWDTCLSEIVKEPRRNRVKRRLTKPGTRYIQRRLLGCN